MEEMKRDGTYYRGLKQLLVLTIIAIAVLPMLLIGWSSSRYYRKYDLENTTNSLQRIVSNRKEVINRFLKNQVDLISTLVKLHSFEDLRQQDNLERLFAVINEFGVIVDLGVIDARGNHLAYVGPYRDKLAGKNYAGAEWFQETMLSGSHISNVFSGYRRVPHFVVAVSDPHKNWVLRATINSEIFNSLLKSAQVSPESDAFIISKDGEFQTPSLLGVKRLSAEEDFLLLAYHEGTRVRTIRDTLYATSWLKDDKWVLVMKLDHDSLFEAFNKAKNYSFYIVISATFLIMITTFFIVKNMVNRIETTDRANESLNDQIRQVEKMALIGKLAASVAHEVNNPLQMIGDQTGWIEELLAEEDPDKIRHLGEYQGSIQKIKYHIKRAAKVTHRLLGFSRKMESDKELVNVNNLIDEIISFLEKEATSNNIFITKQFQEDLPTTMIDAYQLQQVFLNLLNNALDAVGKDGRVMISTRKDADRIVVDFEDTGPGIKPELLNRVFEPFFTTKKSGKGTGLGLSICYNIMQRLGGEINVENQKPAGTKFTIKLPIIKLDNSL